MCVVSDQATAIGVTAVPTPVTDDGSDLFFVYERLVNDITLSSSGAGTGNFLIAGRERIVDSKAMRKVEDGSDLILTTEGGPNNDGFVLTSYMRVLVKLH
jgi:hypothetical protein